MAKINTITTGTSTNNMNQWKSFFEGFNSSLINVSTSGTTLTININNGAVVLTIVNFNTNFLNLTVTMNETTSDTAVIWSNNGAKLITITCMMNENIVYIQWSDGDGRKILFLYERVNLLELAGYKWVNNTYPANFRDITELNLQVVSGIDVYKHGNRLNYQTPLGTIDYTDECLFSSDIKSIEDNNFIACTAISAGNLITMQEQNYFAVGAHTLILLDDE